MPLQTEKAGDCRGTEVDGSKSEKWCSLCYVGGKFVDPNCSLQEMTELVESVLKRDGASFILRKMAKRQLPRLERWR